MTYPNPARYKKRTYIITGLALVVLIIGGCFSLARSALGPRVYWEDFEGWSEEKLIDELGEPSYDSRQEPGSTGLDTVGTYTLGWRFGWSINLAVKVNNGKVISYYRGIL